MGKAEKIDDNILRIYWCNRYGYSSATLIEYKNESKGILNYYLVDCGEYQNENKNVTENRNFVLSIVKKINSCTYGSCRFTAGFD